MEVSVEAVVSWDMLTIAELSNKPVLNGELPEIMHPLPDAKQVYFNAVESI